MAKNVKINGATFSDVPSIRVPLANGTGYAKYIDEDDAGGSGMNVQAYHGMGAIRTTSYSATGVSLTVAKSGTYKISWIGIRNTNSGTSGSQLYINGSAYGSANTSFTNTYGQSVVLSGVTLNAGQTVEVRARARSTSYYMTVGNLIIEQIA